MRVAVIFVFLIAGTFCLKAEDKTKKFTISAAEQTVVDETNAARKKANLPPLKPAPLLFAAARKHSADMAKENTLAHKLYDKTHIERVTDTGYKWIAARENIAFNQPSPKDVVTAWMGSEHHKENILADDITEIGVGIVNDSKGQPYYTQVFGRPEADLVQVKFSIKNNTRKELSLDLDLSGGKPVTLKPGENSTYVISAATPEPSITVQVGDQKSEVKVKNNAKLTAEMKDDKMEVTPAQGTR
jgi:hypothetical protein